MPLVIVDAGRAHQDKLFFALLLSQHRLGAHLRGTVGKLRIERRVFIDWLSIRVDSRRADGKSLCILPHVRFRAARISAATHTDVYRERETERDRTPERRWFWAFLGTLSSHVLRSPLCTVENPPQ